MACTDAGSGSVGECRHSSGGWRRALVRQHPLIVSTSSGAVHGEDKSIYRGGLEQQILDQRLVVLSLFHRNAEVRDGATRITQFEPSSRCRLAGLRSEPRFTSVQSFGRPRASENRRCRRRALHALSDGEKRFGHFGWMFVPVAQAPTVSASLSGPSDEFPAASVRTRPTALGLWPDLNDRGPRCSASLRCDRDKTPQVLRVNSSAIIYINPKDRRKIRIFPKKNRNFREFTKHLRDAPW